jgi:hypothetical protein
MQRWEEGKFDLDDDIIASSPSNAYGSMTATGCPLSVTKGFPILDLMDQEGCRQKLFDLLHPEGFVCPRCGAREGLNAHRRHPDSPVAQQGHLNGSPEGQPEGEHQEQERQPGDQCKGQDGSEGWEHVRMREPPLQCRPISEPSWGTATIRDKMGHSCPNVCLNRALRESTPPFRKGSGRS